MLSQVDASPILQPCNAENHPTINPICLPAPGHEALAKRLAAQLNYDVGLIETRRFPDGERYLRVATDPSGADVLMVASLADPDPQLAGLIFLARTVRELGAKRVGLVAPYLAYMRQDARFRPGEAISAPIFARLLSGEFDWLVTVDPHLHRIAHLRDIYTMPTAAVAAAPSIAHWVRENIPSPVIVGPDAESEQWVQQVARLAGAPSAVLEKHRIGDREVIVRGALPNLDDCTPVLIDDIISSGTTMADAVRLLRSTGSPAPVCVAVHALFAKGATEAMHAAGAARVVSCNTIDHPTNAIDVLPGIAAAISTLLTDS